MASPTGIIAEALMFPEKKAEVIAFLLNSPLPGNLKRELLLGWAQTVGVRVTRADLSKVELSGVDV